MTCNASPETNWSTINRPSAHIGFRVAIPIFIGGAIYTLFSTTALYVFDWYRQLGLLTNVMGLRAILADLEPRLPAWFLYSLPDGLWVFAYTSLMVTIWRHCAISTVGLLWVASGIFLGLSTEVGQAAGVVPGTFDLRDIAFYITGFLLGYVGFYKRTLEWFQNE